MKKRSLYLLSLFILLILYHVISLKVDNNIVLPKITGILAYFRNLSFKVIVKHTSVTFYKAVICFIFSVILALLLSFIAGYKGLYGLITPYMSILKTVPTISVIIVALIIFGKEKALYLIPVLVILPILYEAFFYQINNVDKDLKEVCEVYRFTKTRKLYYLYFYPLLEGFMVSFKQTFGLCFKIIVMAEVIANAQTGIGSRIQNEKINLEMAGVFSWTIILVIIILILDSIMDNSTKKILKWKYV